MKSKIFLAARILFAIMLLVFGTNKFFNFLPPFEVPEVAQNYFGSLIVSKTFQLVAIVEIVAGLALLLNKYGALLTLIVMSVSVNAVLFHITLAPSDIAPALVLLTLNITTLFGYMDRYKDLLKP